MISETIGPANSHDPRRHLGPGQIFPCDPVRRRRRTSSFATVRPFAQLAARILMSCESFGGNSATAAYDRAYLLRSFLNNRQRYRQDPQIAATLRIIDQIIARDPSDEVRPNAVMDRISELIEARDLDSAEALIPLVRDGANAHDTVTVRCLEAVVALHRGNFDAALSQIDDLLALELYETHLAVSLGQGLAQRCPSDRRTARGTIRADGRADSGRWPNPHARQRSSRSVGHQRWHARACFAGNLMVLLQGPDASASGATSDLRPPLR
jgi:hypothetical protein